MDTTAAEIIVSALLIIGGAFTLLGSIGMVRLPDIYTRLHGPTKSTTLGIGALVIASVVHSAFNPEMGDGETVWRGLAISLFLFLTAPITASLMAKAARARDRRRDMPTPVNETAD